MARAMSHDSSGQVPPVLLESAAGALALIRCAGGRNLPPLSTRPAMMPHLSYATGDALDDEEVRLR